MSQKLPIRIRTLAAAMVVIASGLIIFYAYQSIIESTDGNGLQALPIIHADKDPFRYAPENPGGLEIPNRGNALFNLLKDNNEDTLALNGVKLSTNDEREPETLFENEEGTSTAGFEMPIVPETRSESLFNMIDDLDQNKDKPIIVRDLKQESPESDIDNEINVEAPVIEVEQSDNNTLEETTIAVLPSKKPNVSQQSPKTFSLERVLTSETLQKRHYIQLASLRGEEAARDAYASIRDDFPKLVEGTSVFFPTADLGARGIFTRIQIGPFDQAEAKSRCAEYTASARGGTCLVLSR